LSPEVSLLGIYRPTYSKEKKLEEESINNGERDREREREGISSPSR
jgi:hypothetical protein